jgi:predicted O-methyltransferase YrrM
VQLDPSRILEVGSYEGASACYLIDKVGKRKSMEIHCVDTWEGGIEHKVSKGAREEMRAVEERFKKNIQTAKSQATNKVEVVVHRSRSDMALSGLIANGKEGYFDFVYIDGSHQAPDVLCDALLGFRLLKVSGVMVFDDYLWQEHLPYGNDPIRCPKLAIDAFTNIYCRKLKIISGPLYQLYVQKLCE